MERWPLCGVIYLGAVHMQKTKGLNLIHNITAYIVDCLSLETDNSDILQLMVI